MHHSSHESKQLCERQLVKVSVFELVALWIHLAILSSCGFRRVALTPDPASQSSGGGSLLRLPEFLPKGAVGRVRPNLAALERESSAV